MSTITAVGPTTTLDGPRPVPPPNSLVETLRSLNEGEWGDLLIEATSDERPRWLNGVSLWGYPADLPLSWDPCSTGTYRTKSDASDQPSLDFEPFGIYLPIKCSSLGLPEGFEDRAEAALEAAQSFAVARALAAGVSGMANPALSDVGMTILASGSAVSPGIGLSYLEDAIGDSGRRGIIHVTPPIAAGLQATPLGDELTPMLTPAGNLVVVDGGYADVDPPGAAAAPGATQAWAYASGLVEVRLSAVELVPEDLGDAFDQTTSEVIYRAERWVLATFDGAVRAGVLIDWAT